MQVHQGDHVVVTLHNTYWRIAAPVGGVLTPVGSQADSPSPDGSCLPGVGCGTVRAEFVASTVGTAKLTASRTTCGEAMGCPPGQGHFEVDVVVS